MTEPDDLSPPDDGSSPPRTTPIAERSLRVWSGRAVVVLILTAVACALGPGVNSYSEEQRIAQQIQKAGGKVEFAYFGPEWSKGSMLELYLGFHHVTTVAMSGLDVSAELFESIRKLPNLIILHLDRTSTTDTELEYLAAMTTLQDLSLQGTQISDVGLEHLEELTNLRKLTLTGTRITDSGLRHLLGMTHLVQLDLSETAITDAAVPLIVQLTAIRYLNLKGTQITPEVGRSIKYKLPTCGNFGIIGLE